MNLQVILTVVFLGVIFEQTRGKNIASFAGPWTATVRYINNETTEVKSTGKLWVRLAVTSPRRNQPQYYNGVVYSGTEINDNMKIEVRVSKRSNNQWKRNAFVLHFDRACSDTLFHAKFIMDLAYGRKDLKCPLPKINARQLKNQTMDIDFPQFPVLPYGRYLFTWTLVQGHEVIGVFVADASIDAKI